MKDKIHVYSFKLSYAFSKNHIEANKRETSWKLEKKNMREVKPFCSRSSAFNAQSELCPKAQAIFTLQ